MILQKNTEDTIEWTGGKKRSIRGNRSKKDTYSYDQKSKVEFQGHIVRKSCLGILMASHVCLRVEWRRHIE